MALQKEKQTIYGYTANYWKITKVSFDIVTCFVEIELQLFKDRNWRLANPSGKIESVRFSWTLPEMFALAAETTLSTIVGMAYAKIKEPLIDPDIYSPTYGQNINWFTDAEDVLESV